MITLFKDKSQCCGCGACLQICPKNAISVIKNECNFISKYNGGDGAVRELIEYIIRINNKDEL